MQAFLDVLRGCFSCSIGTLGSCKAQLGNESPLVVGIFGSSESYTLIVGVDLIIGSYLIVEEPTGCRHRRLGAEVSLDKFGL